MLAPCFSMYIHITVPLWTKRSLVFTWIASIVFIMLRMRHFNSILLSHRKLCKGAEYPNAEGCVNNFLGTKLFGTDWCFWIRFMSRAVLVSVLLPPTMTRTSYHRQKKKNKTFRIIVASLTTLKFLDAKRNAEFAWIWRQKGFVPCLVLGFSSLLHDPLIHGSAKL